jgi:hypothetical protein
VVRSSIVDQTTDSAGVDHRFQLVIVADWDEALTRRTVRGDGCAE